MDLVEIHTYDVAMVFSLGFGLVIIPWFASFLVHIFRNIFLTSIR